MSLHLKYKLEISLSELESLRIAILMFCADHPGRLITSEAEIYRLSDLRDLYYNFVTSKMTSLNKAGRDGGQYEIKLSYILTLHHVLTRVQCDDNTQHVLNRINKLKVNALPVNLNRDEILF